MLSRTLRRLCSTLKPAAKGNKMTEGNYQLAVRSEPYPWATLSLPQRFLLGQKLEAFNTLTRDFPTQRGHDASKEERKRRKDMESFLTYGEIEFMSVAEVFELIGERYGGLRPGGVFYDLGAGIGKGVIAGALLHPFSKCVGIELLSSLHSIAEAQKRVYDSEFPAIQASSRGLFPTVPQVEFVHDSFFEVGWADASVILANSTCFPNDMMTRISEQPAPLGTFALTLTRRLLTPHWLLLDSFCRPMSWGEATVFIQKRIS